jgi:hypothetical protein
MERLIIGMVLIAGAVVVALWIQRRQGDPPTQPRSWTVPVQLDRADFDGPEVPWLVALFTSATCDSCRGVAERAAPLASSSVVVQEVEVRADGELHKRYGIDAVPTLVMADAEGVVRASFVGPVTATDLWATLAEVREPGSVPPGCDHGQPPSP